MPTNTEALLFKFLKLLRGVTHSWGTQYSALCPAHGDNSPSLSVSEGDDGRILVYCHCGCTLEEIVEAMGLTPADLFPGGPFRPVPVAPRPNSGVEPPGNETFRILALQCRFAMQVAELHELSGQLGLPCDSLVAMDVGYCCEKHCWTFPERNSKGEVIGITNRWRSGFKCCVDESKRGLSLPRDWDSRTGPVHIAEGPTDTAALWAMGLAGIGRPSASGGIDLLCRLLRAQPDTRDVIVLGENDQKPDRTWPGRDGALRVAGKLATALQRPVNCWFPPAGIKDVREFYLRGGRNVI